MAHLPRAGHVETDIVYDRQAELLAHRERFAHVFQFLVVLARLECPPPLGMFEAEGGEDVGERRPPRRGWFAFTRLFGGLLY